MDPEIPVDNEPDMKGMVAYEVSGQTVTFTFPDSVHRALRPDGVYRVWMNSDDGVSKILVVTCEHCTEKNREEAREFARKEEAMREAEEEEEAMREEAWLNERRRRFFSDEAESKKPNTGGG